MEITNIRVSEVIALLKQGYVRWRKHEKITGKSIQSHYNLSFSECQAIINIPQIKGVRTKNSRLNIVDDIGANANVGATITVAPFPTATATIVDPTLNIFG